MGGTFLWRLSSTQQIIMSDYSNTHWMKDSPDPKIVLGPQEYVPEIWSIKKDLVYKTISCLQSGLENTQSALIEHDVALGRTTTKNRMWAETLEQEIKDTKECIRQLKTLGISHTTHYP